MTGSDLINEVEGRQSDGGSLATEPRVPFVGDTIGVETWRRSTKAEGIGETEPCRKGKASVTVEDGHGGGKGGDEGGELSRSDQVGPW